MKTLALRIGTLGLLLPLGACMNMSGLGGDSKYACKAPEGVACDSVSGTYANAVHNNLPSQRTKRSAAPRKEASEANPPESTLPAPSHGATGDADTVVIKVKQNGPAACHTGNRSCFYVKWENVQWVEHSKPLFDPNEVYKK